MKEQRYFLTIDDGPEKEVTVKEFVRAEKQCGFRGHGQGYLVPEPATAGFSGYFGLQKIRGRMDPMR